MNKVIFDSVILGVIPVSVEAFIYEEEPDVGYMNRSVDDISVYYEDNLLDIDEISEYDISRLEQEALDF